MTPLTFNLSIGIGSTLAIAGAWLLAGTGWACVAAGGLVLLNTYVAVWAGGMR